MPEWYAATEYEALVSNYEKAKIEIGAARRLLAAANNVVTMFDRDLPAQAKTPVTNALLANLADAVTAYKAVPGVE